MLKSLLYPLAATLSLAVALWLSRESFQHSYFLVAVIVFVATSDLLDVAPLRHDRSGSAPLGTFLNIAAHWLVVVDFIWALITLSGFQDRFEPRVLMTWAAITPPVLWLSRFIAQLAMRSIASLQVSSRRAVIIGHNELGRMLGQELLRDPSLRVDVIGFFDDLKAGATNESLRRRRLTPAAVHPAQRCAARVHHVGDDARGAHPRAAGDAARLHGVDLFRAGRVGCEPHPVARGFRQRHPRRRCCESPFYGVRGLAKRLCDIVLSSAAIVMLSPVFIGVALGVRHSGPGPMIFRQRRYGLDGKEIVVYKFRSMTVTEDGDHTYTQVIRNDSRVTPFGAFIRKTSLDELPQLFNVLEGSMSLVGPRPHAVAVNEQYRKLISGYMVRHKVKPGITGWAQVNGFRGGDDLESMQGRVAADLEYLRHWSLGLDIAILLRTATLVWADRKAF